MTTTDQKGFDCVEMKREGVRRIRERLAVMTAEERLAYWRRRTEELRRKDAPPDLAPEPE
jgi:hypothetical protein